MKSQHKTAADYSADIAAALTTDGGHLSIGRDGFTLHYGNGAMLSGYGCEEIKAQCIVAGLLVINSRNVDFDAVLELTLRGPMAAVGREPDPVPWHGLSFAPLRVVTSEYSAAGADVWNVDGTFPAVPTAKGRTGQ